MSYTVMGVEDARSETSNAISPATPRGTSTADFLKLQDWVKTGESKLEAQRKEQKESFQFVAGDQWDDADKATLQDQMRPVITFNRTGVVVDSVVGLEINNRERTSYYPREMGDVQVSETMTSAAQWVRDETNAEDEETDAFFDQVVCGLGWMEDYITTDEGQGGEINIRMARIDPNEMGYDPTAKKRNLADAKYIYRVREIAEEEAEAMFPGHDLTEIDAGWATGRYTTETDKRPIMYIFNKGDRNPKRKGIVTVVEIQWWERKTYHKVEDPTTGEISDFDEKKFGELNKRLKKIDPGLQLNEVTYSRKIFKRAFLGSADILKQSPTPCPYAFSYHAMTGKRDHAKNIWYGIVRAMKDPQMWANKWLSQVLHIINSQSKGGFMAAKDAFENWRDVEQSWTRPDFIPWLANASMIDKVVPKPSAQFPQGLQYLMEFAITAIRDVTGANVELLGLADRDQPASLEYQRRQAGVTALAGFFNSLRQYRKEQGRCMLYMIQKWISDGRLVRVLGADGMKAYQPLMRSEDVIEYDVIVDESPSSPNQKEAVWSMLIQAMPILQTVQLPPEIWSEILRYSPLPSGLAEKIGQSLQTQPDPQAQQMQTATAQATLALMQAEAQSTSADAQKKQAETQRTMQQAQTEPATRVAKLAAAQKDMADAHGATVEHLMARLEAMERKMMGMTMRPQPELQPQPNPAGGM